MRLNFNFKVIKDGNGSANEIAETKFQKHGFLILKCYTHKNSL